MTNLVFFSSVSGNTKRFIEKLGRPAARIPLHARDDALHAEEPFVLVVPTYGGTVDIGFGRARVLVGTVNVDVVRQQGTTAFGLHVGGRTESRGVALVSIAAAIGGLIVAAALSDGLY